MSEWIDVKAKAKGPVEAEDTDGTPLSRAQLKNKKRAAKRKERVAVLKALVDDEDRTLAEAAQRELLARGGPAAGRPAGRPVRRRA